MQAQAEKGKGEKGKVGWGVVPFPFPLSLFPWLAVLLALALPRVLPAQDIERQIRQNQARLEAIRKEREQLQDQLSQLRGQAHGIASELVNIERQKSTTNQLVNELDRQIRSMGSSLDTVTLDLALTEDALAEKRAVLQRRLTDIYKRGPLWTFQVLLSAESFGDLLSRYKYLYLVSQQDRSLVSDVEQLRGRIAEQRRSLLSIQHELAARRDERNEELDHYVTLERERQRSLRETRASERAAVARLDSLSRDAQRLNDLVASLERARRAAVAASPSPGAPSISSRDLGTLDWPVAGDVIYRYGPFRLPNNTTVRENGIGIKVPLGTPVHAVAAGVVRMAEPWGTYGPSVIVDHGGGFYTLYLYLSDVGVRVGEHVVAGQVVGTSGGQASEEGPHVEFQIRGEGGIALDPLNWLKSRR
jgi:septal ring factor EnvC (AmiA/AmiB activator)